LECGVQRCRPRDGATSAADRTISPEIVWLEDRVPILVGRTHRLANDVGAVEALFAPLHVRETSTGQRHRRHPSVSPAIERGAAHRSYEGQWHTTQPASRHGLLKASILPML
ncbi:hypothetical protein T11_6694, partial [Trichinella zimbabwensis]